MNKNSQGGNANQLGRMCEDTIEDNLKRRGFVELDARQRKSFMKGLAGPDDLPVRWYARNVRKYLNLYGARFYADFVLYDVADLPMCLIIEVKNQEMPGSVDEKYVFTALTLKQQKIPSWLVISGQGIRASALEWLKGQETATFSVLSESEFRRKMLEFD